MPDSRAGARRSKATRACRRSNPVRQQTPEGFTRARRARHHYVSHRSPWRPHPTVRSLWVSRCVFQFMSESALSEVSMLEPSAVVRGPAAGPTSRGVLPRRLHHPGCTPPPFPRRSENHLQHSLRGRCRDVTRCREKPEAFGSAYRVYGSAPHVVPNFALPSPRSLCRAGWRAFIGSHQLGQMQTRLLSTCPEGPLQGFPWKAPRQARESTQQKRNPSST